MLLFDPILVMVTRKTADFLTVIMRCFKKHTCIDRAGKLNVQNGCLLAMNTAAH